MAQVFHLLARLKRDPLADLLVAVSLSRTVDDDNAARRDRLLPALVTLRLFLIQIAHGNCAIAALRPQRSASTITPTAPTQPTVTTAWTA